MMLGKRQLHLLLRLASPTMLLVVPDKISDSLVRRGYAVGTANDGHSMVRITPAGMRALADAYEAGMLEQFMRHRHRPAP